MSARGPAVSALVPILGPLAPGIAELVATLEAAVSPQAELVEILFLCTPAVGEAEELRGLREDRPELVRVIEIEHAAGEAAMLRAGVEHAHALARA